MCPYSLWGLGPQVGGTNLTTKGSMDTLAERLRRRPAKPMGSPRVGSNPTGVVCGTAFESWGDASSDQRGYRSHFGSRYKLGCCDHASLLGRGSNPAGGVSALEKSPNVPPVPPKLSPRRPETARTSSRTFPYGGVRKLIFSKSRFGSSNHSQNSFRNF